MFDGFGYAIAKSIDEVDPKKIAKMAVEEALDKIGGKSIASGNYPIIVKNESMVSMISTFAGISPPQ